jgi:HlyD family secretion protein
MMAKLKNKWIWIVGGISLLVGLFAIGFGQIGSGDAAAAETGETAVAFIGDLAESVSASGQVVAGREADLSLTISGRVDQVDAAVGDAVNAGDVLVRLDTASLDRAVASAELDVVTAEADLADLLAGPTPEDVAAAEAAVASAQTKLDDLLAGPSEEEIASSQAAVQAARANVDSAAADLVAAYDVNEADIMAAEANLETAIEQQEAAHNMWVRLADCEENENGGHTCAPTDNDRMETATQNVQSANAQVAIAQVRLDEVREPDANSIASAQASLAAAEAGYDAAVARHEALILGASDSDIAAAEADLAGAQASLESLIAGPSETDIDIYRISVAQAETALQEAQNALTDASLVAPFDGTITSVHVNAGEQASGLAVGLIDDGSLEVILSVDEVDLGRLTVGQPAVVTLETWPDIEIDGVITSIAPSALDSDDGMVSYKVHLGLGETDLPVLVGMTANADLVTARREGVLLVPNAAITADRNAGTYTVNLVNTDPDGTRTVTPVEVSVGLKDSNRTQIIDGLAEGNVVVLGQVSAPAQQGFGPPQRDIVR